MLRGYIDAVTTMGYIEGWAFDTDSPAVPVPVSIKLGDEEVAWGLAHRFRADLMEAGYGVGWCAFRLRLDGLISDVQHVSVRLVQRLSNQEIAVRSDIALIPDTEPLATSVANMMTRDPTVLGGIWQLNRCDRLFMEFIGRHGIDAFLSAAYAYVLGRPLDDAGRELYTRCLRQATLAPLGILTALEKSEEYSSRPRPLAAPSAHNFPFVIG